MKSYLVALTVFAALPAFAQQQAVDPLKEICTNFLAQGGGGVSGDANRLCTCLVKETQARLTRREMELYNDAALKGQAPPDAVMEKVMGIATTCLTAAR